jgi:alginate O-acetyltransferase complex protein AlgI
LQSRDPGRKTPHPLTGYLMLLGLFAALAFAPLYWLAVPTGWRREVLSLASLVALGIYDYRLVPLLLGVCAGLVVLTRTAVARTGRMRLLPTALGLAALAALFLSNKLLGHGASPVPSQGGLLFLGVSFLVLKAAAALIDAQRGGTVAMGFRETLAWIVLLPTYPSGPMETLEDFRRQWPTFDRARVLGGLERILFGLVKALLIAYYLGVWVAPIVAAPQRFGPGMLLLGLYAWSLRFYFDFAGYSDLAIGLSAVFGYDIAENFDRPFLRRNLVQLWQHWHMTLTHWLRAYLFVPVTRRIMRRTGPSGDRLAIASGQIVAMTFCGVWHGVGWNFALWGFLQALGLIWVGIVCRDAGRRLPPGLVAWWRHSTLGYALSTALTFNFFSLAIIFMVTDVGSATRYLARLLAL